MTNLKSRRDMLAGDYLIDNDLDFVGDENDAFKAGFDAAISELKSEIDKLVKALGQVSGCFNCDGCRETAIETITKYKEFMGDNDGT